MGAPLSVGYGAHRDRVADQTAKPDYSSLSNGLYNLKIKILARDRRPQG
jgi:hypothetical protein